MLTFNALYESIGTESGKARTPAKGLGKLEDCKPLVITLRILTRSLSGFFCACHSEIKGNNAFTATRGQDIWKTLCR